MALSVQSIENLIDLVEIKLGAMEVYGESDVRDLEILESTRCELIAQLAEKTTARQRFKVVPLTNRYSDAARSAA